MHDQFTTGCDPDGPTGLLTTSQGALRAAYPRRARGIRKQITAGVRALILDRDAYLCGYCGYEADQVDHIVPWSYGGSDEPGNLVACCSICNSIAGNRVFDRFEDKRDFVRSRYGPYLVSRVRRIRRRLSICGDCGSVFEPRVRGASAVLCGPCYRADEERWQ